MLCRSTATFRRPAVSIAAAVSQKLAMPDIVEPRHKSLHFGHIMRGYAAGYYSYDWSRAPAADIFETFVCSGDIFNPELAQRLDDKIFSAGDGDHPAELCRAFLGRDPQIGALLKQRGFAEPSPQRRTIGRAALIEAKPLL